MNRPTPDAINDPFKRTQESDRRCAHPGCLEEALYRAPVARNRLQEYRWFCLEHIRAFNRAWDYFAGMNEEEIEAQRRFDTVWNRPTWPIGGGPRTPPKDIDDLEDDFGFFGKSEPPQQRRPESEEARALADLGLEPPVTFEAIKSRYIALVKLLHPDANGGQTENEERLKKINLAYARLRTIYG